MFEARQHHIAVPQIAVEIDGHDFHERTKGQVEDRNRRDRDLQAAGWKVFHFSGAEVYRSPEKCVREVMEYAAGQFHRVRRRLIDLRVKEVPT